MMDLTVGRSLRLAAERYPDRTAVTLGDGSLTHGELNALGNRFVNGLNGLGFAKGDRIGVFMQNCLEYVAVGYAIAKGGFVMVPLNYRFNGREIANQLNDAGARGIIFSDALRGVVEEARGTMPNVRTVVAATPGKADAGSLAEMARSASPEEPGVVVREGDLFYLGYTSGTSGKPKGAIITHRNRSLAYHYWAIEYGWTDREVSLHAGPFHHSAPFGFTLAQLALGGRVAVLPSFDALEAVRTIQQQGVTWSFMVPYMYNAILALGPEVLAQFPMPTLHTLISAASPLPTPTKDGILNSFPNINLHEFYGATEAGVITSLRPEDQRRKIRCVGRPVFDTEIKVLDEDGKQLGPNEVGELYMRGPTFFDGYHNAPEKTAEAFRGDWCTLGDLGRMDEEGYVYIVDRSKDVIKSGGVNIFPAEIEEALLTHPAVFEIAVVGAPSEQWGEEVRAVIVLREGKQATEAELIQYARDRIAPYKVPKAIEFRTELPRSPAGKILKRMLRDEFWANRSVRV